MWVSFVEIFHDQIYDLLETYQPGKVRENLKPGEDKNGHFFIKGGFSHFLLKNNQAFFTVKTHV